MQESLLGYNVVPALADSSCAPVGFHYLPYITSCLFLYHIKTKLVNGNGCALCDIYLRSQIAASAFGKIQSNLALNHWVPLLLKSGFWLVQGTLHGNAHAA